MIQRSGIMKRYRLIRNVMGGSEVYDDEGNQVGYSLPSILGGGEDFYDMNGNPAGQSFDDIYGANFIESDTYGFIDKEISMGQNVYLHGDPFKDSCSDRIETNDLFSEND